MPYHILPVTSTTATSTTRVLCYEEGAVSNVDYFQHKYPGTVLSVADGVYGSQAAAEAACTADIRCVSFWKRKNGEFFFLMQSCSEASKNYCQKELSPGTPNDTVEKVWKRLCAGRVELTSKTDPPPRPVLPLPPPPLPPALPCACGVSRYLAISVSRAMELGPAPSPPAPLLRPDTGQYLKKSCLA